MDFIKIWNVIKKFWEILTSPVKVAICVFVLLHFFIFMADINIFQRVPYAGFLWFVISGFSFISYFAAKDM